MLRLNFPMQVWILPFLGNCKPSYLGKPSVRKEEYELVEVVILVVDTVYHDGLVLCRNLFF